MKTLEQSMKTSENWMKTMHKLKKNIEKPKKTIEKWKKTMEQLKKTMEQLKTPSEKLKKSMEKLKNIMEKLKKIMDKPMKTMENSIKPWNKSPETSGKIDEQCEWEILATKCSKWEILAAKTKEGSLDDQKKMQKICQFNFAPQKLSVLNDVVNHHEPAIGDVSHSAEPISAEIGNPQIPQISPSYDMWIQFINHSTPIPWLTTISVYY